MEWKWISACSSSGEDWSDFAICQESGQKWWYNKVTSRQTQTSEKYKLLYVGQSCRWSGDGLQTN